MSEHNETAITPDIHRKRRRRLLAALGTGLAGAYVAPTLFSVGQAQAGGRWSSYSRPSYSRPSYSRPSRYRGPYRRERRRLREYEDEPVRILEDILLGPPRR
ncbi:hypothetical protein P1P91_05460 [Halomonas piscis]|uniref:Uncharacterized protein n=1 Tax=Halomonas piscis TaxID=3031727 RepID=A0ABY9Z459_9GAMM|nr:hypothetical protein [Halomonas piscis]WNK21124.1 hypothetical protein P1P91_05460 [Halomonas piscis]